MSIVDFSSGTWTDPWFRKLPFLAKGLFIYLWTNNHKNLAGLYPLDIETMRFETGLPVKKITQLLEVLYPKVQYDFEQEIVWVKNHVKHQFMRTGNVSLKIIIGLVKSLMTLPEGHPFIGEFLEKYHTLSIDYPYPIQSAGYPPSEGKGEGKSAGKGKVKGEKGLNSSYSEEGSSPPWSEMGKNRK